jgi:hypothetical protein
MLNVPAHLAQILNTTPMTWEIVGGLQDHATADAPDVAGVCDAEEAAELLLPFVSADDAERVIGWHRPVPCLLFCCFVTYEALRPATPLEIARYAALLAELPVASRDRGDGIVPGDEFGFERRTVYLCTP